MYKKSLWFFSDVHASRSSRSAGETRLAEISAKIGETQSLQQTYSKRMVIFLMAVVFLIFQPMVEVNTNARICTELETQAGMIKLSL